MKGGECLHFEQLLGGFVCKGRQTFSVAGARSVYVQEKPISIRREGQVGENLA